MVTLLGGAPVDSARLRESLDMAPLLIAADGGAMRALEEGLVPAAVIGDMDSLPPEARTRLDPETICEIAEQNSTDFDKALRNIEAPLVIAVGFTGARLDHELAVYAVMARRKARVVVLGSDDVCFHAPRSLRLDLPVGSRVSLFPMAPVTGRSEGLRWPIEGLHFAPNGRVGTSNEAVETEVTLEFDGDGMLVILPRSELSSVVRALLS
ncbi:thiamine diphosphokinase [Pseudoruegeria sp. HB172150]|uniref:thiamine diphosphokinase n=1 Tax=Pseudoruegeria sp. HB172150 TaxID=2721164 RepID=UPI00352D38A8